jgi:23S rRNA G2445 N2-methylase RlmL
MQEPAMATSDLSQLIAQLDTDDLQQRKQVGAMILAVGHSAIPTLIEALQAVSPRVRQSAAFLLGRLRATDASTLALEQSVGSDSDPKVRKLAAVALGTHRSASSIAPLMTALREETVAWVRPSLVLALGAIGSAEVVDYLRTVIPRTDQEQDALNKACAHALPQPQRAMWRRDGPWRPSVLFDVPIGFEAVAAAEAHDNGLGRWARAAPAQLACPGHVDPTQGLARLRCVVGMRIPGGTGLPLPFDQPDVCARHVAALLQASIPLQRWRDWLEVDGDVLRYRITVQRHAPRQTIRAIVAAARTTGHAFMLQDSPSSYAVELVIETTDTASQLSIHPTGIADTRFGYRRQDVPAAINPVIAACLARLVRTAAQATVVDPTCGSGTLLIERALAGETAMLIGFDHSRAAVRAAAANIAAAQLQARIRLIQTDALDRRQWPMCDEVMANLPFGVRTANDRSGLRRLYDGIVERIAERLTPDGRAVLYTSQRRLFEHALHGQHSALQVEQQLRTSAGGLEVFIWVIRRRRGP